MKKMRPAANGIRTIRHCIGALSWDILLLKYFPDGSLEDWLIEARKAAELPGGKYAKWLAEHREWADLNLWPIQSSSWRKEPLWETGTPDDKECILYHMHRSGLLFYSDVEAEAEKRGLKFSENDKRHSDYGTRRLEEAALSGHGPSCQRLARSFQSPFWVVVTAALARSDNKELYRWAGPAVHDTDYELGILYGDLKHFGICIPSHVKEMTLRCSVFAVQVNAHAKQAVDTWLLLATRLRVVKDIRRVIGLLLWSERLAWAEPVYAANGTADIWNFSDAAPPSKRAK